MLTIHGCQQGIVRDDRGVADIERGRAARNVELASIPVGFAGRAALGFGNDLTGRCKDEVDAELMEKAANQLFTGSVAQGRRHGGRSGTVGDGSRDPQEEFGESPIARP